MTAPGARLFIDVMGAFVLLALAGFEPFVAQLEEGRWRLSEDLSFVFKRRRAYFVSAGGRASEIGRARSKSVRLCSLGWAVFAESEGELLCLNYDGLASAPAPLRARPLERPVFRDEFSRDPDAPSDWKPVEGEWRIRRYRDALVARDRGPYATGWLRGNGARAVSLTGRSEWCAFRAAVSVRIVRGSGGIVFGGGRFAFEVAPEEARLVRLPEEEVLARAPCRAASWTRLVVRRGLEEVCCYVDGRELLRAHLRHGVAGKAGLVARGEALFDDFEVRPLRSFSFDSRRAEPGRIAEEGEGWAVRGPAWPSAFELDCDAEEAFRLSAGGAAKLSLDRNLLSFSAGRARGACEGRPPVKLILDGGRASVWKDGRRLLAFPVDASRGFRAGFSSSGRLRMKAASFERPRAARASFAFSRPRIRGEAHGDTYSYEVVGHFLRPSGRWKVRGGRLVCEERGELRFREPLWGEAGVRARLRQGPGGAFIASRGRAKEGYRVLVESGRMRLYRLGDEVACSEVGAGEGTLALSRVGRWVQAGLGERTLVWRDGEPLTGGRAGLVGEAGTEFDDLELSDLSSRLYRFDRVETDWEEACGDWRLHTGIACIAWGRWITGGKARGWKGVALMQHKLELPRDLELRLSVSESTDGMPDGNHVHYPYHDIILGVRADSASVDDGYVFRVARSGRGVELLRKGEVVARYEGLSIRMGSHCNSPRELGLAARARGKEIALELGGREVISFRDPEPLSGRTAFFGVADCRANFSDVVVTPLRPWEETLPPLP